MPAGLMRRGASYSLRRRVPKDLIDAYGGRQEIVRALGTTSREEAKRLHALAWVALDEEFAIARARPVDDAAVRIRDKLRQIADARRARPHAPRALSQEEFDYVVAQAEDFANSEVRREVEYDGRALQREQTLAVLNVTDDDALSVTELALRDVLRTFQAQAEAARKRAEHAERQVQNLGRRTSIQRTEAAISIVSIYMYLSMCS